MLGSTLDFWGVRTLRVILFTMSKFQLVRSVLVTAALFVALGGCQPSQTATSPSTSIYSKVSESGVIRAAYINYPPACIVDPKTKEVTGIFPDALRAMANNLKLKVEFKEEVGWATLLEGFQTGRYDMIGAGVWANATRGKLAMLSNPAYYSGIGVWVRPNETRVTPDNDWASLNNPNIRIAAIDGSTPLLIAQSQFPKAKIVSYPDQTSEGQLFLDVQGNKADVFFAEPYQGAKFLSSNAGAVKNLAVAKPLRIFADVYVLPKNDPQFKSMIDNALQEIQNDGTLDKIIKKYEGDSRLFYRVAPPYVSN